MTIAAALMLVLVLPAVAGGVLLSPAPTSPRTASADQLIARGLACGLATWLLGSGLLARTVDLTATSAWVWDGCVAAVSIVVLLLPRQRARLRPALASMGRRFAVIGGLSAVVFLPLWFTIVRTSWSPLGSTPWYYYGLARQVAEVGSIPATSLEFGTSTPFLNDYHLFTTGTAMLLVQYSGNPITVVITITLLGALLLALGMTALTSALGVGRLTALLAVPIVLATGIGPIRLAAYRPEGFALGLTVLMVALSVDWLRNRDWRALVAAGLIAATLSQVHGIAALSAGVMIVAAALVSLARGRRAEQLRRSAIALGVLVGAVVVSGLVFHEASGTVHAGGLVDTGGLADPTWEFYRAARDNPSSMPPTNLAMMRDSMRSLYDWQLWWIVPTFLLALVGLWRTRRDAVTRQVVAFTVISLVGLLLTASVFMLGWQGYVPRRTGANRLVVEMSLLGPPLLATGLGALTAVSWPWRGRRVVPNARRGVGILLAVLTVSGAFTMIRDRDYYNGQAPTPEQLAIWRSIPAKPSDVVLSNGYTEGFIPDQTGAQGLLDGRAPYTFAAQMARATSLFRGAADFFDDPAQNWDFLAQNDVSWVVVGDPDSFSLGTPNVWDTPSPGALDQCAGLRKLSDGDGLTVYRVVDSGPNGC